MEGMRTSGYPPHVTYLITLCCYGSHIPGEDLIVSKRNNHFGARVVARISSSPESMAVYCTDSSTPNGLVNPA
jgi:hypothetical protein